MCVRNLCFGQFRHFREGVGYIVHINNFVNSLVNISGIVTFPHHCLSFFRVIMICFDVLDYRGFRWKFTLAKGTKKSPCPSSLRMSLSMFSSSSSSREDPSFDAASKINSTLLLYSTQFNSNELESTQLNWTQSSQVSLYLVCPIYLPN